MMLSLQQQHIALKKKDYSLKDELKSGRTSEINLNELKQLIETDPTLTTREMASKLACSQPAIIYHFKDLRLVSKLGELIPHDLSKVQLKKRVEYCQKLLSFRRTKGWVDNLITGDEKWVLYANIVRKRQWLKPGQTAKPTPKADLHPKKRMLSVWWGVKGVVYWELLPENSTVNGIRYCNQLQKMATEIKNKGLISSKIYFQHDNARPHVAKTVKAKL